MNIKIEHTTADGLSREVFMFLVTTGASGKLTIAIAEFEVQARPTRRHKWKASKRWPKYPRGTRWSGLGVELCDGPLVTDDLRAEVWAKLAESTEWVHL